MGKNYISILGSLNLMEMGKILLIACYFFAIEQVKC